MKRLLEFLCFMLVAGGLSGLLHEMFGWFRLFGFLRYLSAEGYEIHTNIALIVIGLLVGYASTRATDSESAT